MEWAIFIGVIVLVVTFKLWEKAVMRHAEEPSEHKSGSFQYKLGKDSGWVLLYQIAGWLGLIGGLIWILGNSNWANGVYCILVASSAFFAAHVLRLMEKTAHNSEQQTELLQKLVGKH